MASRPAQLRALLASGRMVVAPGAYDCITGRLIEQAGFSCIYMTGAGTSATLGFPDYGLITQTEMTANAGRIARATKIPVIADADTGYGNELNVFRTVQEYEREGVAGIHIEDQVTPKRCGHLDGKEVISIEDYAAKIRAAADARQNPDFLIIARTDARAVTSFDDAIARANAAIEAGADMAFVEAMQTMAELEAVPKLVRGPCMLNIVHGGKTPEVPLDVAEAAGYKLTILPGMLLRTVIGACDAVLQGIQAGQGYPSGAHMGKPAEIFHRMGADEWLPRRDKYRDPLENRQAAE
jgi:2-methylisocitrate lyase-like PEP mutase family enzyme